MTNRKPSLEEMLSERVGLQIRLNAMEHDAPDKSEEEVARTTSIAQARAKLENLEHSIATRRSAR